MSAKRSFTFQDFKIPLLPLLTHSALDLQGDFFDWSRPKSSKCWRWQNLYQKSESKGMSQRKCENLTKTFTFLVGILPSPTLRTFRAGPVKKNTLYKHTR